MSGIFALVAFVFALLAYNRVGRLEKIVDGMMKSGVTTLVGSSAAPLPSSAPVASFRTESVVPFPSSSADVAMPTSGIDASVPTAQQERVTYTDSHVPHPQASTVPLPPNMLEQFFHWCAVDWLMKLGAFFLFLSISWVVTVFLWDSMGPITRVSLGLFLGLSIFLGGMWKIEKYPTQAIVLIALGAGVIDMTIFAAQTQYQLFSPFLALTLLFLVVVSLAYLSVSKKSQSLAFIGLALGGIAPFLTGSSSNSLVELFSYLFVLCVGTLWVTRLTGWRHLSLMSMILYALYAMPLMMNPSQMETKVLVAIVFSILFFVVNILSIIHDEKATTSDLVFGFLNGLILLGWINGVVAHELRGIACILVALIASVGAYLVYAQTGLKQPVYIHSLVAAVFLGIATAYEFDGSVLVIVYALEVLAIALGMRLIFRSSASAAKVSLASVIPALLSLESMGAYLSGESVLNEHFFALLVVMMMFAVLAIITRGEGSDGAGREFSSVHEGIAWAYMVFILLVSPLNAFPGDFSIIVIAYMVEVVFLTLLARVLFSETVMARVSLGIVLPLVLSLSSIGMYVASHEVFNEHFFAIVLVAGALGVFSRMIRNEAAPEQMYLSKAYRLAFIAYGLVLLWVIPQNAFPTDVATGFSLLIYTMIGLASYIKGRLHDDKKRTFFGTALLVFVIAHLLLVDVGKMNDIGRIFTFGLIGVLLMSSAFIGKKK